MAARVSHVGTTFSRAIGGFCGVALVVSLAAAALAGSASATTSPGFVLNLQVTITDSQMQLIKKSTASNYISVGGHSAQFPRGILIHFLFTNKGTRAYVPAIRFTNDVNANPYAPKIKLVAANKVTPGRHVSLYGNFYFRGAFQIEKLVNKKSQGRPIAVTIY
jgi:hypothetical protein